MSIFENIKKTAFATVANTMGTVARWYINGDLGGVPVTAKVLFNAATDKEEQGGTDYYPQDTKIEYYKSDFVGLRDAVKAGNTRQIIEVNGEYWAPHHFVAPRESARDGDTYVLIVRKPNL